MAHGRTGRAGGCCRRHQPDGGPARTGDCAARAAGPRGARGVGRAGQDPSPPTGPPVSPDRRGGCPCPRALQRSARPEPTLRTAGFVPGLVQRPPPGPSPPRTGGGGEGGGRGRWSGSDPGLQRPRPQLPPRRTGTRPEPLLRAARSRGTAGAWEPARTRSRDGPPRPGEGPDDVTGRCSVATSGCHLQPCTVVEIILIMTGSSSGRQNNESLRARRGRGQVGQP